MRICLHADVLVDLELGRLFVARAMELFCIFSLRGGEAAGLGVSKTLFRN